MFKLQQYLPLAVLKQTMSLPYLLCLTAVATVLTACGIETHSNALYYLLYTLWLQQYLPLAVLKHSLKKILQALVP